MKDLDFDELDRAVNSLMSGGGSRPAGSVTPVSQPVVNEEQPFADESTADTPAPEAVPAEPKAEVLVPASKPSAPTVASPIVPQRRSGRFMDVVHPSSDMKSSNNRPKSVVTPINADITSESVEKKPEEPVFDPLAMAHVDAPSTLQKTSDVSEPELKKQDEHSWPDPIDMHEKSVDSDAELSSTEENSSLSATPEIAEPKNEDDSVSDKQESNDYIETSSPFLPDAKVEKRPLGGLPSSAPTNVDDKTSTTLSAPKEKDESSVVRDEKESTDEVSVSDDVKKDSSKPTESLPAELSKDIIAVEAAGNIHDSDATEKDDANADKASEPKVAKDDTPLPGMTSITQQYKIKPTSTTPEHTPIYADSGQPLSHPKKTKSGWLTIVWIIALIIVGAGGTLALYFFNVI